MSDYGTLLDEARADRDRLKEEYGTLLTGDDAKATAKAKAALSKADSLVLDLEERIAAVEAAKAKSLRDEAERLERERKAELARLLEEFNGAYGAFAGKAAAADKAFDAWLSAMEDLEETGRAITENFAALNLNKNAVGVIRVAGWLPQIFNNMRNYGPKSMRAWWNTNGALLSGSGKRLTMSEVIPSKARLFGQGEG